MYTLIDLILSEFLLNTKVMIYFTMRCGAEMNITTVVITVYTLSPMRQNLSITIAANFQSEMTSSSSSFSRVRFVKNLIKMSLKNCTLKALCWSPEFSEYEFDLLGQVHVDTEGPPGGGAAVQRRRGHRGVAAMAAVATVGGARPIILHRGVAQLCA